MKVLRYSFLAILLNLTAAQAGNQFLYLCEITEGDKKDVIEQAQGVGLYKYNSKDFFITFNFYDPDPFYGNLMSTWFMNNSGEDLVYDHVQDFLPGTDVFFYHAISKAHNLEIKCTRRPNEKRRAN